MGIREQLIANAPADTRTVSELTQKAADSQPAIARLDDAYTQAETARVFNRFIRDTVESLGAIVGALNALESRVAALEAE